MARRSTPFLKTVKGRFGPAARRPFLLRKSALLEKQTFTVTAMMAALIVGDGYSSCMKTREVFSGASQDLGSGDGSPDRPNITDCHLPSIYSMVSPKTIPATY